MEVKTSSIINSPSVEGHVRLSAEVNYDDMAIGSELYWFEVSEKYAEFLSKTGNPWLVCLLSLAVTLGEPLRIHQPIDRVLFENIQKLMRIWRCWYPHLHVVSVEANLFDTGKNDIPTKTAAFFSGGVDSFLQCCDTVIVRIHPRKLELTTSFASGDLMYC